jgi:hypothetical protein
MTKQQSRRPLPGGDGVQCYRSTTQSLPTRSGGNGAEEKKSRWPSTADDLRSPAATVTQDIFSLMSRPFILLWTSSTTVNHLPPVPTTSTLKIRYISGRCPNPVKHARLPRGVTSSPDPSSLLGIKHLGHFYPSVSQ